MEDQNELDNIQTERDIELEEEEETNSADGMTEEEYEKFLEERKEKQDFLKQEIISNGYQPDEFTNYIADLKEFGKKYDNFLNQKVMMLMNGLLKN